MKILVLGAYGLLGLPIAQALAARGHTVVGLGRSVSFGKRVAPKLEWIGADIARLTTPEQWVALLSGVDAVVNAAGALQSGAKDRLEALHVDAISALVRACEERGVRRFVQISAPGAAHDATTSFMRTKARGDDAVRASALEWVVFKPGLVISPYAYGGTALLRSLAAFPLAQPLVLAQQRMQTVALDDVVDAVVRAVEGGTPSRCDYDLVEEAPHTLREIVARWRAHLGFGPARLTLSLPLWFGFPIAWLADVGGWLGWRSPLRTTALRVLEGDVLGDPAPWRAVRGAPLASLEEALARTPSSLQERVFARAQLVLPILLMSAVAFWMLSGAIGLIERQSAAVLLAPVLPPDQARWAVLFWSVVDLAIGGGMLFRRTTVFANIAAIVVCLLYALGATLLTPVLWSDPLGPLVKIVPVACLSLALLALLQER
ncbi:MAG TPA: SDR family oxidoreductase [Caulobacterales bacterium]|nr:SDR family oxidoreductase [Caulobacterales bacterium]